MLHPVRQMRYNAAMNEEAVRRLVQLFAALTPTQRQQYAEDDTKANLIEPLFAALGWRMGDEQEVQRNRRSGSDQPDYTFRLNGVVQFFVEAKPLREDLDDMRWIRQAIGYAFNKGVPWAVLTNFQRLIVFDAYEELAGMEARPRALLLSTLLSPGGRRAPLPIGYTWRRPAYAAPQH